MADEKPREGGIDNPPGPIDPTKYASWVYVVHGDDDDGRRSDGWWWHNKLFNVQYDGNDVILYFTVANIGWSDARSVMIDYFVPTPNDVLWHQEVTSLQSGERKEVTHKFTVLSEDPGDNPAIGGAKPWVAIRVTDLNTPAPSILQIKKCLAEFVKDPAAAIAQLSKWKMVPGFFAYPCCALFPGLPQH